MAAGPGGLTAMVACLIALGLLAGAVQLGLQLPGEGALNGFGRGLASGRSLRLQGAIAPLRSAYVDAVLGPPAMRADGGLVSTIARSAALRPATRAGGPVPAAARTLVVDHPFTNDNVADAIEIPSVPFTAHTDSAAASREPGEPTTCSPVGGTVWYRFTPTRDVNLLADTFGTAYPTALAVYDGGPGQWRTLGCDASPTGNSQVGLAAAAGHRYWFQITGPAGGGRLIFDLAPAPPTTLASVATDGTKADRDAYPLLGLSATGRFVVFSSQATNLGGAGTCTSGACTSLFVRDRQTGQTAVALSIPATAGTGAGGNLTPDAAGSDLWDPQISADGRLVVFYTTAALLADDTNGDFDVYLVDRATGRLERESVSSTGQQGETPKTHTDRAPTSFAGSKWPGLSPDGRFVVFTSDAANLVAGDNNGQNDVFVRDRVTGRTELISVAPSGHQMERAAEDGGSAMSPDGRFITYWGAADASLAPTPEPLPHDGARQVYVRDRLLGTTTLASPSISGGVGNLDSYDPSVSADGRYVSFISEASNLVAGDTNSDGCAQVAETVTCGTDEFRYDTQTRTMSRVSVSSSGDQQVVANSGAGAATDTNYSPASWMSDDGRYITFRSNATNLVPGDPDGRSHIYLHDCLTGATTRASVSSTGEAANDDSLFPVISRDGLTVAFISLATNLDRRDTNSDWDVYLHEYD